MQRPLLSRRLPLALAALACGIAAAVSLAVLHTTPERGTRSEVAAEHITRSYNANDDASLFGWMRAQRRAGARSEAGLAAARVAEQRPTVAQVLVFFDALLNDSPADATAALGSVRPDAQGPSVAQVLVFFHALLNGPTRNASIGLPFTHVYSANDDALLFDWMRAEAMPDAARRGPTVAQVLVFFSVLLSGAPHQATIAPSPKLEPAPVPPPPPTAPAPAARPPASASTPIPPPPPAPAANGAVWIEPPFTQAVWDAVNARRTQLGMAPVAVDARLARAASGYAVLISEQGWFSHTGPDGSSFVDRITAAGFPFEGQVGEVLALGTDGWPAAGVVQAWIDSPPHREQLLNPDYRLAGLGCAFAHDAGRLTVRCAMEFAA